MHVLGHSWGGMLAIEYLVNYRPAGVRSVVLSSSLPACWLWGEEQHRQMLQDNMAAGNHAALVLIVIVMVLNLLARLIARLFAPKTR